jgi:rhodanese-related sulfurtransferase
MFDFLKSVFGSSDSTNLEEMINNNAFLVDVRTPAEFGYGHPKGSINIPLDVLDSNLDKFKNKQSIVVFCRSGNRSGQAKTFLESNGFENVVNGGQWENVAQFTGQ